MEQPPEQNGAAAAGEIKIQIIDIQLRERGVTLTREELVRLSRAARYADACVRHYMLYEQHE